MLAIKQTLYRTSGDSPIVDALIDAAEAGKQVLAVVEIKARFDEQNNISWARKLEHAGVHVVYGIVGLKTHAKLCLVIRQEAEGLRRYCHVGTGNYNPKTARLYEDLGLLTVDDQVGQDLTRLFNQLSGIAPRSRFKRLLVAPRSVRSGLIDLIDAEIEHEQRQPGSGHIAWKVNSIVDEQLIDALYRASQAGVKVQLWVRGICALRPGVPGLSENIEVRSILGRFLEHSRIFLFGAGGDTVALIGSADMMHRNLDRRVEALVRLDRPAPPRRPRVADGARHERRVLALEARRRRSVDAPPPRRGRLARAPTCRPTSSRCTHGAAARPAGGDPTDRGGDVRIPAAGTLPWRLVDGALEVALVHRPRYDDWSWAKGKLDPGEDWAVAAVRETEEETGLVVRLGPPLPEARYTLLGRDGTPDDKVVRYWSARVIGGDGHLLNEIDEVVWLDVASAHARLDYARDRDQLLALVRLQQTERLDTWPLVLVRHAHAVARGSWREPDDTTRPLDPARP